MKVLKKVQDGLYDVIEEGRTVAIVQAIPYSPGERRTFRLCRLPGGELRFTDQPTLQEAVVFGFGMHGVQFDAATFGGHDQMARSLGLGEALRD